MSVLRAILRVGLPFFLLQGVVHAQWVQASGPDLRGTDCFAVSEGNLFAGTGRGGVFRSTNNGTGWIAVNTGLTTGSLADNVNAFAVSGTNLFAGTIFGGVWRRPVAQMITSVSVSSSEVPATFKLEQNYPNPFNPTTTIRFALPRSGFTKLMIFNLLGEEVSTVISERLNAGSYTVTWGVPTLASGVYIDRLQAGDFVETKKLLLIR
ncbi:MAG TPA: T9SS type A sorting domain-containing protein [Bacteroidota bacterium]|nr:T9SS type A sorting domain-containing protein [Bacteroidota bacterium]